MRPQMIVDGAAGPLVLVKNVRYSKEEGTSLETAMQASSRAPTADEVWESSMEKQVERAHVLVTDSARVMACLEVSDSDVSYHQSLPI